MDTSGTQIIDRDGQIVGTLQDPECKVATIDIALAENMVKALRTSYAHRVVRWQITQAHRQWMAGVADFRTLSVEGGWSGLAEIVGVADNKREQVRSVVEAQAHGRFRWPDGSYGNMLIYNHRDAVGGRPAELTLTLGNALLPQYVQQLPRNDRKSRRLVPVVEMPPRVGRHNDHAAEATLQWRLMLIFRERVADLMQSGSILLLASDVDRLAHATNMSPKRVRRVLQGWTEDRDDALAFLVEREQGRYTLGPAYEAALNFLMDAARSSERARQRARRRSHKRR